jgi:hypothetical protein
VIQAAWAHLAPRTALAPPSPEAKRHLSCNPIDTRLNECLRVDAKGRVIDTQYRLLAKGKVVETPYRVLSHGRAYADEGRPRRRVHRASWRGGHSGGRPRWASDPGFFWGGSQFGW